MGKITGFTEFARKDAPKRPVAERVRDYREIEQPLPQDRLQRQAARCMDCGVPYFLCAPGTHRPLIYPEMVAKLGREVVEKYTIYNHSIWENLVDVGKTSRGTPVHINREFVSCDLRLAVGSLLPHSGAGFGGGAKIILPGISGIETIS